MPVRRFFRSSDSGQIRRYIRQVKPARFETNVLPKHPFALTISPLLYIGFTYNLNICQFYNRQDRTETGRFFHRFRHFGRLRFHFFRSQAVPYRPKSFRLSDPRCTCPYCSETLFRMTWVAWVVWVDSCVFPVSCGRSFCKCHNGNLKKRGHLNSNSRASGKGCSALFPEALSFSGK